MCVFWSNWESIATYVWHLWSRWSVCWGSGAGWQSRHYFWLDSWLWPFPPPPPRCCLSPGSGFGLWTKKESEKKREWEIETALCLSHFLHTEIKTQARPKPYNLTLTGVHDEEWLTKCTWGECEYSTECESGFLFSSSPCVVFHKPLYVCDTHAYAESQLTISSHWWSEDAARAQPMGFILSEDI